MKSGSKSVGRRLKPIYVSHRATLKRISFLNLKNAYSVGNEHFTDVTPRTFLKESNRSFTPAFDTQPIEFI